MMKVQDDRAELALEPIVALVENTAIAEFEQTAILAFDERIPYPTCPYCCEAGGTNGCPCWVVEL